MGAPLRKASLPGLHTRLCLRGLCPRNNTLSTSKESLDGVCAGRGGEGGREWAGRELLVGGLGAGEHPLEAGTDHWHSTASALRKPPSSDEIPPCHGPPGLMEEAALSSLTHTHRHQDR